MNDMLNELLISNENEHIEFKEAKNTYNETLLCDYVAAIANEKGGKFVLGITDKKPRKIVGTHAFANIEKIKKKLLDVTSLKVDIDEILSPDGRVLIFNIPSRPIGFPIRSHGNYKARSGESLIEMPQEMLKQIFDEGGLDFSAEICPNAMIDDLDKKAIEEFRKRWLKKSGNEKIMSLSIEQLLIDTELMIDNKLTYASLILFGTKKALGRHLSQAEVIFEYKPNDTSETAQQREEYRMGFFSYFDDLWKIIDLRNTNQHFQDGLFIWDIKTFNESAIRESILNAISHRDYRMGASVYIRQFPDKIEITNPGGLPHGITFENILWQQSPRNRLIADVFSKCGLVERSGQGMNRIYETCISESKGVPDFNHSDENNFWITLHGKIQNIEFLKVLEKIGQRRVRLFNADDLLILLNIFDNQSIPLRLNISAEKLSDEGLLEKKPNSRGSKWVLARKLYVAVGQAGVHTRKKGLDRDTNKELLLNHIKSNGKNGAKMEELRQVLPSFSRSNVLSLLRSLRKDGLIIAKGERRGAKWFLVE